MNDELKNWLIANHFQDYSSKSDMSYIDFRHFNFEVIGHNSESDEDIYSNEIFTIRKTIGKDWNNTEFFWYHVSYSFQDIGSSTSYDKKYPENYEVTLDEIKDIIKFFKVKL